MISLSDKNRYYLSASDFYSAVCRFLRSCFPNIECAVPENIPEVMLSFEEDFFARALTKTMRRYMRAVPTRVGLECTEDSVILKITYVDTQNVRYLTELSRLYLLSKCDYNVNSYDGHTDITLALKTDRIKNLRVYADNKDRLHAALINAFESTNDRL